MRLARYRTGALAVVFALLTLTAWAFASPIGAAPDDDYHLVSTWCAGPLAADACEPVEGEPTQRAVPEALESIACYAQRAEKSADCQGREFDWAIDELVVTDRGNFQGAYPPVYYAVNGLLSSDDVQASALGMRMLTILVFLGIAAGLWLLLPERRTALVWGWLITTIPLGAFIIASNNPSAWAVIGVGTSWMASPGRPAASSPSRNAAAAVLSSRPGNSRLAACACWGLAAPLPAIFCQTGGEDSKRIA